jgi:hypothetical protein
MQLPLNSTTVQPTHSTTTQFNYNAITIEFSYHSSQLLFNQIATQLPFNFNYHSTTIQQPALDSTSIEVLTAQFNISQKGEPHFVKVVVLLNYTSNHHSVQVPLNYSS